MIRPDFTVSVNPSDQLGVLFTFNTEHAEMYMGYRPISVDMDTALYMLQQRESMPYGRSWGSRFPAVVNHTSSYVARKHPDFEAAKHGDFDAAIRLIDDLVKDDKVLEVAEQYPDAHVAYIHRRQSNGINMIPAAYAAKFAALGMTVDDDIIAVTDVKHTNASDIARLGRRMRYEGEVNKGKDYILLDDFITTGAELRDLRDYISSKGGNVVMITTFGHGSFGKLKDIRIDNDYKSKLQQAGITDQDLRRYGIASEIGCLTISEAAKLNRMVNRKRERQTSTVLERFSSLRQEQSSVPSMAKELPENEGRRQVNLPLPVTQHPSMRR